MYSKKWHKKFNKLSQAVYLYLTMDGYTYEIYLNHPILLTVNNGYVKCIINPMGIDKHSLFVMEIKMLYHSLREIGFVWNGEEWTKS